MTLKTKFITLILFLSSFVFAASALAQQPVPPPGAADPPAQSGPNLNNPAFVPGEVLVKFKGEVMSQSTQRRLAGVKGRVAQTVPAIDVARVEVPAGQELAAVEALRKADDVAFVEPNYLVWALDNPNDPGFGSQWGYTKAQFPTAWDVTQGNGNITVAVIDSGIDLDHPDFNCAVSTGASKLTAGYNFVSSNNNPDDDNGHGTHVAGTVGACTNNGTGVAGSAPNVRLMPLKVLNSSGSGSYSSVADAIVYAADNGAKIINLSLGGPAYSTFLADAVDYAHAKGVLLIAASGNSNTELYYPSAFSRVMAVGSTGSNDTRSSYSNYGADLDVVAPGEFIYSTVPEGYSYLSGTSMASPHVAGLAALVWSAEPGLTNSGVRQLIRDTADDIGFAGQDDFYGYGRINAWQALEDFATVQVQYASGGAINGSITFFVDDVSTAAASSTIRVSKATTEDIVWNAALSPDEPWISVSSSGSGVTAAVAYGDYNLEVTQPATYGTYTTNLVFTGETASGAQVGPETVNITLVYTPEIKKIFLPMLFD